MAGLVPAIHVFLIKSPQDVDARVKPAHDGERLLKACLGGACLLL
jgi:hypothetical protein